MNGDDEHARAWLRKAENDLTTIRGILQLGGPYDMACFHAQQAVEKVLKAALAASGRQIIRTHDLVSLFRQVLNVHPGIVIEESELALMTPYAVELRYNLNFSPDRDEALDVFARANRIREAVLVALGDTAAGLQATPDPASE